MENNRQVYLLDPHEFSPETIAVTFAKTSRSHQSYIQIASELNESKSAEFNEKWVVGYGHSSVAEHAVLHIAVENISRLACECLESNRLASYTEKSTRYQTWNADAFYIPAEIQGALLSQYIDLCHFLLNTYQTIIPPVVTQLAKMNPAVPAETPSAWERRIRSAAIDSCRFLLPSAALANVGMTINARALEHALVKMLSHPLAEVRQIGVEIKSCAVASIPTLLKYAEADESLIAATAPVQSPELSAAAPDRDWCRLVFAEPDAEDRILAAYLFRQQSISYAQSMNLVKNASTSDKAQWVALMLASSNPHSIPLRELEHANFTFEITLDQGAYYEVKRHRMLTLTPQPLTPYLGYALPKAIIDSGQAGEFSAAMSKADQLYRKIAEQTSPAASYIIPNAFNRRFLLSANLRSLLHFIQLRSAPNAHFSVRRLAQSLAQQLSTALPAFAPSLPTHPLESVSSIESTFFSETMKEGSDD